MKKLWYLLPACAFAALAACNPIAGPLPDGSADLPGVQFVPTTGAFSYTVDAGVTPHDVYFVFTNTSLQESESKPQVTDLVIRVDGKSLPAPAPQSLYSHYDSPRTLTQRMAELNRDSFWKTAMDGAVLQSAASDFLPKAPLADTVGQTLTFNDWMDDGSLLLTPAACRYTATVDVSGGTRTLNVWVADNCWEGPPPGSKTPLVTQAMVDALADKFLKASLDNDIYDWETSILGSEWGPTHYSNLISGDDEITILLTDINNSDSDGVIGYFSPANNFTAETYPGSNERIMFVIDAVMFADPGSDGTWSVTDEMPDMCFSTLTHEFQHMIQFYQKDVLHGIIQGADVWVNEMCSLVAEDLMSDKISVLGPRGVNPADGSAGPEANTAGRIPGFNAWIDRPLIPADGYPFDVQEYSIAYSFGAWLARNYGGAQLLKSMVTSADTDQSTVTNAILAVTNKQETFERLLQKWACSMLLSNLTTTPAGYRFNTGGWTSSATGGVTFNLGSINFFNYNPQPRVYTPSDTVIPIGTYWGSSNIYFQAASGMKGLKTWQIELPEGVGMSVVVK